MKKAIAIIAAVCLVALGCVVYGWSAGGKYTGVDITVKNGRETVCAGQTVDMQLLAVNVTGKQIVGFMYDIAIESDTPIRFEKKPVSDPADNTVLDEDNVGVSALPEAWTQFLTLTEDNRLHYMSLLMDASGAAEDGVLMNFSFTVPDGAKAGDTIVFKLINAGGPASADNSVSPSERGGEGELLQTLTLTVTDAVPGDLDRDGEVTIQDVMEACKVLARQSAGKAPTEDEMIRGNLDGDNAFTISDVMEICKILARKA